MSNILILTKLYFKTTISSLFKKASKKNKDAKVAGDNKNNANKSALLLILLFVGFICYSMFNLYSILAGQLVGSGLTHYVLMFGLIYFNLIVLMMFAFNLQGYFFKTKDYDLIASMPIKNHEIIISKLISIMFISYIFEAVFFGPAIVSYFMVTAFSFKTALFLALSFLLLPIFILCLSIILVLIVNYFSSKVKKKNIMNVIGIFIMTVLVMASMFYLNYTFMENISQIQNVPLVIKIGMPTVFLFIKTLESLTIVNVLMFLVVNLSILAFTGFLVSSFYFKINHSYNNKSKSINKKPLRYEQKSVFGAMLKQDFLHFVSMPTYVTNALIAILMLVIFSIVGTVGIFKSSEVFAFIKDLDASVILAFIIGVYAMFVSLSNTTNVSISIEGSKLQVKKSMPIQINQIFYSKILLNIMVVAPFLLISFLAFLPALILLSLNAFEILLIFLSLIILLLFSSVFGFFVNLLLPKLDWKNEAALVKQSMSVMVTVFSSLGISMIYFSLLFGLGANGYILVMSYLVTISIAIILMTMFILTKGKKRFVNMS